MHSESCMCDIIEIYLTNPTSINSICRMECRTVDDSDKTFNGTKHTWGTNPTTQQKLTQQSCIAKRQTTTIVVHLLLAFMQVGMQYSTT